MVLAVHGQSWTPVSERRANSCKRRRLAKPTLSPLARTASIAHDPPFSPAQRARNLRRHGRSLRTARTPEAGSSRRPAPASTSRNRGDSPAAWRPETASDPSNATGSKDKAPSAARSCDTKDTIDAMPTSKNWSTIGVMTIGVLQQPERRRRVGRRAPEPAEGPRRLVQRSPRADGRPDDLEHGVQLLVHGPLDQRRLHAGAELRDSARSRPRPAAAACASTSSRRRAATASAGRRFFNFANSALQGNNLDQALMDQGVPSVDSLDSIYDTSFVVRRADHEGQALVLDRASVLGLRASSGPAPSSTRTRSTLVYDADPSRPGDRFADQHQRRPAPDVADLAEEQAVGVLQPGAARHQLLDPEQQPQPDSSQLQNVKLNHFETVTFKSTITSKMLLDLGMGNMTETWTREPIADSPTVDGLCGHRAEHRHHVPRLPGTFSQQLHVGPLVSRLAVLRARLARDQVRVQPVEGPANTDVYTTPRHAPHRPPRAAVPGAPSARRRTPRANGWWPTSASTCRTRGRSSG